MKKLAAVVTVAVLFAFVLAPAWALQDVDKCCCKEIAGEHSKKDHKKSPPPPQEGKKRDGPPEGKEKKGPPPGGKEGDKHEGKCGKDPAAYADELRKRKDITPEEIDAYVKVHFKLNHPDGCCHCSCGHKAPPEKGGAREGDGEKKPGARDGGGEKKPGPRDGDGDKKPERKCGKDPSGFADVLKQKGFGKDEIEQKVKDHFKSHPDGCCHCFCGHDEESGKKDGGGKDARKGNNGVGNGVDPQPPGKPPVNDGAGTGPGNPGNKKGGDGKGGDGKK